MNSSEQFEQIRNRFPHLVAQNFQLTCFKGFIEINNTSILVKFKVPHFPFSTNLKIYTPSSLNVKISKYNPEISGWMEKKTFYDFLCYYRDLLSTLIKEDNPNSLKPWQKLMDFNQYIQLQNEMLKIAQDDFVNISARNNQVRLVIKDESNRELQLNVIVNVEYPNKSTFLSDDLSTEELEFIRRGNNLVSAYQNFLYCVQARQNIWASLDEIDTHCWVLFPQNKALNELRRRIYLGNNIFCDISFTLNEPRPNIELAGPTNRISRMGFEEFSEDDQSIDESDYDDELEVKNNIQRREWDVDRNIVENLLIQLNIKEFPKKPAFYPEHELNPLGACALCFEYDREKVLPVLVCPSERCANVFHRACLNETPGLGEGHDNSEYPCPLCAQLITNFE